MGDLVWDEVKNFFDPEPMGDLPDVRVPGASVEDWQAVLDLISASGRWFQYAEGDTAMPLPVAATVHGHPALGYDVVDADRVVLLADPALD